MAPVPSVDAAEERRRKGPLTTSVVIPAYNASACLPACLAALAAQTVPPGEVIVVDDGSQDETAAAARRCGARVLRQDHAGPARARNLGVSAATGEVILFTDADCEPDRRWVEEMLRPFEAAGTAGVKGVYRTRQPEVVARLAQCEFEERYNLLERRDSIDFVDSHSAAFRADALRDVGGFDPSFPTANNEDVDLSYRLAHRGHRLVFTRAAVVYHRHKATWRGYFALKLRRGYWRMAVYRMHPSKAVKDSYTPQLLKAQVALAGVLAATAAVATVRPALRPLPPATAAALLLSALPFVRLVLRHDRAVVAWAPAFVVGRAFAFALGAAAGALAAARPRARGRS